MATQYDEKYFMEKQNATEVSRLSKQHDVFCHWVNGRLIQATIDLSKPGLRVLDSGTADGTWLRSLLPQLNKPETLVGIDIAPSFGPPSSPPPIKLVEQSIEAEWPSSYIGSFDLVHQRFVIPAAGPSEEDAGSAIRGLISLLKPGGWIQFIETDHSVMTGEAMADIFRVMKIVFSAMGLGWSHAQHVYDWLKENGMEDVEQKIWDVPTGKTYSDRELTRKGCEAFSEGARGLSAFTKTLDVGLDQAMLEDIGTRVKRELREEGGVYKAYCVWGGKSA